MSKVINVKKAELNKLGYGDLEQWLASSADHVYIGRDMCKYVKSAVGSKWANPYKKDGYLSKGERLSKYEQHIRSNKILVNSLRELDGKILGCWCWPEKCHGDVLIKLINEAKILETNNE
jgi:hypothetical protein